MYFSPAPTLPFINFNKQDNKNNFISMKCQQRMNQKVDDESVYV